MAEKNRIKIPPYIVRKEDRKPFVEALSSHVLKCQKAYQTLVAMPDLENIPERLQDINVEDVENFIKERLTEISATKMLTSQMKADAKENWEKVRKEALACIRSIKDFLTTYPDADVYVNNGVLVCRNLEDLITEHCRVQTPDIANKYAELILDTKEALDALWAFEKEQGIPGGTIFTLTEEMKLIENPEKLVETVLYHQWRKDYLEKHPYIQEVFGTSVKVSLAEQNARLAEKRRKHFEEHSEDFIPLGNKTSPYENWRVSADCLDYSVEMK